MRTKTNYISNDAIMEEWRRWKDSGTVSERLGELLLVLGRHIMQSRYFCGYPEHVKGDIVSDGTLKCLKNLKNFDPTKGCSHFSYLSRCIFTAGASYLAKHYRHLNRRRELLIKALRMVETELPQTEASRQLIRELERLLADYGDGGHDGGRE